MALRGRRGHGEHHMRKDPEAIVAQLFSGRNRGTRLTLMRVLTWTANKLQN